MYLLYTTRQEAWDRSEEEGIAMGLSYHRAGKGSRYVTSPQLTADGHLALPVDGYELNEIEQAAATIDVIFPQPETDEPI